MSAQPPLNQPAPASPWYLDDDGYISTASANAKLRFGFIVADVPYEARFYARGQQAALLVSADIAPMPYSAESPAARNALYSLINGARNSPWGSCGLSPQQRITVAGEVPIARPIDPIALVSAAIRFVLQSGSFTHRVRQEALMHVSAV